MKSYWHRTSALGKVGLRGGVSRVVRGPGEMITRNITDGVRIKRGGVEHVLNVAIEGGVVGREMNRDSWRMADHEKRDAVSDNVRPNIDGCGDDSRACAGKAGLN